MFVWLALLISVLTCAICLIWHKRVHWAELIIPFVTTFSIILISKSCAVDSLTWDEEWLGGYVERVEYYEDWDEWVKRTCSYTTCSGTGKTRSCTTHYYDCSFRRYHPEHWVAVTSLHDFEISKQRYDKLCKQFGGKSIFKDMHRGYYTNDGDSYFTMWNWEKETIEPVAEAHHYENRPQAALNIFKYERPDSIDIKRYRLFDYPKIVDHKQPTLLGYADKNAQIQLHYFNGVYGAKKQVRIFVLVFESLPREAGIAQENYWAGGNKNEFVVCVGKYGDEIRWAHTFSWTDEKMLDARVRHEIESLSQFDATRIVNIAAAAVLPLWKRKEFSDFNYLTVNPTPNQTFWIFFWAIISQIGVGLFIVLNPIDKDGIDSYY